MAHHMGTHPDRSDWYTGQTHLLFSLCFFHDESCHLLTKKEVGSCWTQWMEKPRETYS